MKREDAQRVLLLSVNCPLFTYLFVVDFVLCRRTWLWVWDYELSDVFIMDIQGHDIKYLNRWFTYGINIYFLVFKYYERYRFVSILWW